MKVFVKAMLLANVSVVVVWTLTVLLFWWRAQHDLRARGVHGLVAMAGGWTYLLHKPTILVLLTASFGAGLYLGTRWSI
jgi:hypothetical protein